MAGSAIGRAMLVLGDQWTLLILQRAFLGVRRFQDWRDQLKVSESVLAARLRDLVSHGLLVKVPYADGGRTRHEYRLTERGRGTWKLLLAIWQWERAWVTWHTGLPDLIHEVCGASATPTLSCGCCRTPVTAHDVDVRSRSERRYGADETADPPRRHRHRGSGPDPADPMAFFPETMALLGDRWSTSLLAAALLGLRRFGEFVEELRIPPSVLSDRLRTFIDLGVLRREDRGYRLTAKGRAFFDVLTLILAWGERFLPMPAGPRPVLAHRACGHPLDPILTCDRCQGVLDRRQLKFTAWHRLRFEE